MSNRVLMKGNEAIAEAAVKAGCRHYFGYPITPQTEIAHYLAKRMKDVDGVFLQAESEVAAINMVYGAAGAGARVLTSSSSPGISLKQEGFSYIAGAEIPSVVVNVMRCGPGLGGILPAQGDYFQCVKGGGHGDYKNLVLAASGVQELFSLTMEAFDLADKYRILVVILADGTIGQMMEPVIIPEDTDMKIFDKPWAASGKKGGNVHHTIKSIYIDPVVLEGLNNRLQSKYREIEANEVRVETSALEDAEIVITAFGTCARIAKNVIKEAAREGIKVGLIRPITLWPFPVEIISETARKDSVKAFLDIELNAGQMVEDVRLAVNGKKEVLFHGRTGGMIPSQEEILDIVRRIAGGGF
ncbi:MAG: 3-methyl-2-oxobutanoate dehydrogenase subunit VorB [Eubacteriales bacterium]|nr:3-methyl-2-oxobutanoate dehydrogenase subunit VorB [Eubacteriales bacterium]MDD4326768.1 3-methyl-2-oxobutanoate dehydrogenase subunit VorB [Eubacteriales bacterium]MDD4717231.1 3-methyl-2-oxobutanoate dehydrogenase subunit VorB [Eubacteriales bacterium]